MSLHNLAATERIIFGLSVAKHSGPRYRNVEIVDCAIDDCEMLLNKLSVDIERVGGGELVELYDAAIGAAEMAANRFASRDDAGAAGAVSLLAGCLSAARAQLLSYGEDEQRWEVAMGSLVNVHHEDCVWSKKPRL